MSTKRQDGADAVDDAKVEERKSRDEQGYVTKNSADTNPTLDHGDPKQGKGSKAGRGATSDDKKATDTARGPHGHAQDESDGWADLPAQMRE